MSEHADRLDRVIDVLREPVRLDPSLDARIMAVIARLPAPAARVGLVSRLRDWLVRPRLVRVSPLGGLAVAAALVGIVLLGRSWFGPTPSGTASTAGVAAVLTTSETQFVVYAPRARSVALVGDFNDWDHRATPMGEAAGSGVWSVTIPLRPGRYRYAFLVNGTRWLTDPQEPRVLDDEFGTPSSVVTIGGT